MDAYPPAVKTSPNALTIYGSTSSSYQSWCNWGFCLLTIVGADGAVSQPEMDWIQDYFGKTIGVPQGVIVELTEFDYRQGNLESLVKGISTDDPLLHGRALLYDSIRMSRADNKYTDAERQAIYKAGWLLNIDTTVTAAIEAIVDREAVLDKIRYSYFEYNADARIVPTSDNPLIYANSMFKATYGIDAVLYRSMESYGKVLIGIAGADGVVSTEESKWLLQNYAPSMDIPQVIVSAWSRFIENENFKSIDINDELDRIVLPNDARRQIVYDAIRMSQADDYAEEEKKSVQASARRLGVDPRVVSSLERLVASEKLLNQMRQTIFKA